MRGTTGHYGRDPFNQNSNRSDREKRTTSKGGPVFSKLFRLDRTDPLSFGPKFPESLVEWIAPYSCCCFAPGSTKIWNPETETESQKRKRKWKQKRNTESNINDRKLKNFTLHNLVQSKKKLFSLYFLAVPLNIFLILLCLDKVCRSVGYCTATPFPDSGFRIPDSMF